MPRHDNSDSAAGFLAALQRFLLGYPVVEIERLQGMPERQLPDCHFGLGMAIRNRFLWHASPEQRADFARQLTDQLGSAAPAERGLLDPDDLSGLAVRYLWKWLNGHCPRGCRPP
jgi:hypothetical protein